MSDQNELQQRVAALSEEGAKLKGQCMNFQQECDTLRGLLREAERRLDVVRKVLMPQYDALKAVFSELTVVQKMAAVGGGGADRSVYDPWLKKCPKEGIRKMLELLIDKREATRHQLSTWAGVAPNTSYDYLGWLRRAGLVEIDGSTIRLRAV